MTYDDNKNLTSDGVLAMTYDADNRLTDLDKSGVFTQDLVYDWMGRKTFTGNGEMDNRRRRTGQHGTKLRHLVEVVSLSVPRRSQ